jgi:hypothetical protein
LREVFRNGSKERHCSKTIDGSHILHGKSLLSAVAACPERKAFLNRILSLGDKKAVIP